MKIFKINSIEYGWFEIRLGKYYIECSDFLGCDSPKYLLGAVLDLLEKKSSEEWICWQDEPGACIMQINIEDGKFKFNVYDSAKNSDELERTGISLKENCEKCWLSINIEISLMVDNLVAEFSLYENGNGLLMYEKHWADFPKNEYKRLKDYALKLEEKLDSYSGLFCNTY